MVEPHRVIVLAFPGCQILDVTGPAQMFAGANGELGRKAYAVTIAAEASGLFPTNGGLDLVAGISFAALAKAPPSPNDTIIAAGGSPGLREALKAGTITDIVVSAACRGARIVSVCTGAFFVAAAGLLDGRRATTHWNAIEALRRFRPAVTVDPDAIYVRDGDVWTSAGVTAGIDLALALIESDHGRSAALAVARQHVVFPIRPGGQAQFSAELIAGTASDPRLVHLAERIAGEPEAVWSIDRMADTACLSPRSLGRLFCRELNVTPAEFVERVRIDRARRALLETGERVERIAHDCDFGSLRRMDRAFARIIAAAPGDFRARFKPKGDAQWLTSTLVS
jgi:transcriptional regulator GlxA family with amidase domain